MNDIDKESMLSSLMYYMKTEAQGYRTLCLLFYKEMTKEQLEAVLQKVRSKAWRDCGKNNKKSS